MVATDSCQGNSRINETKQKSRRRTLLVPSCARYQNNKRYSWSVISDKPAWLTGNVRDQNCGNMWRSMLQAVIWNQSCIFLLVNLDQKVQTVTDGYCDNDKLYPALPRQIPATSTWTFKIRVYLWYWWVDLNRWGLSLLSATSPTYAAQDPLESPPHLIISQGVDDGIDHRVALGYYQAELLVGVGVAGFTQQPIQ